MEKENEKNPLVVENLSGEIPEEEEKSTFYFPTLPIDGIMKIDYRFHMGIWTIIIHTETN